jgi:DNA-binding beta-propeller fold protein YncE
MSRFRPATSPAALIAAAGFLSSQVAAADQSGVRVLAEGLNAPRGIHVTDAGDIYVALAGSGGPGTAVDHPAAPFKIGYGRSGGVMRFDSDGNSDAVVANIASLAFQGVPDGNGPPKGFEAHGAHDVVLDEQSRIVVTNGFALPPETRGEFDSTEVHAFGSVVAHSDTGAELLVDIGDYEHEHDPDRRGRATNPFSITLHPKGGYLVTDAAANALFHVAADGGALEVIATFDRYDADTPEGPLNIDAVPTGVALHPDGENVLVAEFGGAPFPEGSSRIVKVNLRTGAVSVFADGLTQAIDIATLPDGRFAVLQYMNKSMLPPGKHPPDAGIAILSSDGDIAQELHQIDGLKMATGIAASPEGKLLVSSMGNGGENKGALIEIDVDKIVFDQSSRI